MGSLYLALKKALELTDYAPREFFSFPVLTLLKEHIKRTIKVIDEKIRPKDIRKKAENA